MAEAKGRGGGGGGGGGGYSRPSRRSETFLVAVQPGNIKNWQEQTDYL